MATRDIVVSFVVVCVYSSCESTFDFVETQETPAVKLGDDIVGVPCVCDGLVRATQISTPCVCEDTCLIRVSTENEALPPELSLS